MYLVFVGSNLAEQLYADYRAWAAGAGAGAVTAWLAKSSLTPAKGPAIGVKAISANIVLAIAAPLFAAILIVMASALLDEVIFGQPLADTDAVNAPAATSDWPDWAGGWWLPIAIVIAFGAAAIASWAVNVNRFSLHAMYRNRLIRGFLGASHIDKRKPNRFTDFDYEDNPHMSQLWPPEEVWETTRGKDWQPFHIINIALNIVSTKRLAWQERKAEPFIMSPLHCGSACGGRVQSADGTWRAHGAFRPSEQYGSSDGISLGTALSISGAAASPNMGYNSSSALAFLMTLFNVRLGWWLGNPEKDRYDSEGPRFAIGPLLNEMFGQTTDERKYVYLSDGGHFENLGLYEMVRRRCRLIVVSDAGCDPDFKFEDLGNAVRKIALDLGVGITFHKLESLKRRSPEGVDVGPDHAYCAVGEIDYPSADGRRAQGTLFYIKPGYHGVEGAGIRAYAIANPTFPHQTTGDQFFSESQFESYRALGFEIVDGFLSRALSGTNRPAGWSVEELAKALAHG